MKPAPSAVRILTVDDLPSIHEDYRKILLPSSRNSAAGFDAEAEAIFGTARPGPVALEITLDSAFDGQEGLALVTRSLAEGRPYAVAFVDMRMPPGWDGVETIQRLWAVDPEIQVVICTAYSDYSWTETIRALGHPDNLIVLKKPFDHIEVQQLAHALSRKWLLGREVAGRLSNLDELVRQRTGELQAAEERFARAFNASPLAQCIQALDDSRILEVNQAFEACFRLPRSAVVGRAPEDFGDGLDPTRWRRLLARLLQGETIDDWAVVHAPQGASPRDLRCFARTVTIAGRPCAIWIVRDVTEQLQLEAQLRQSQKMEAVGQLAAGVAHDFNNLLTVIQCYTTELLADEAAPARRFQLESVNAAAVRAATLTRQLLVFSRKQISQLEPLEPVAVLRNLQPMLRRLINETVSLEWQLPPQLPPIVADVGSLEQIVLNLIVNARDALPQGGRIRVGAGVRAFTAASAAQHAEARPGEFIAIAIADNGTGIPPEVLPRIFEPFFTTKAVGQGTGLGLSTVYSLVHQQGGWIDVQTSPGAGTTFTLYYPIAGAPATPGPAPAAETGGLSALPSLRVLAVEDDKVVQSMLHNIFERRGIDCTLVADGPAALARWETEGPFDLLITDVIMPNGLTGIEVARRLRRVDPALPVVFITGYSSELLEKEDLRIEGERPRVLLKPFSVSSLLETMRAVTAAPVTLPAR